MGAIGIARCFTYGGLRKRPLWDPDQPPVPHESLTREAYARATDDAGDGAGGAGGASGAGGAESPVPNATTLNHFDEKLLHLRDRMRTAEGRRIAEKRHATLVQFVADFKREWTGEDLGE